MCVLATLATMTVLAWKIIKKSSESPQKALDVLNKSPEILKVLKLSSKSPLYVLGKFSKCLQKVLGMSSESPQNFFRKFSKHPKKSSECPQKVPRKS